MLTKRTYHVLATRRHDKTDFFVYNHAMQQDQEVDLAIDISKGDVLSLQRMAAEKGILPETLAASILHKYVTGQLKPVSKHT